MSGPAFVFEMVARCPTRGGPVLQIWLMAAQFEVRQLRLDAARKILGMALGLCPKDKIFTSYIALELQLGNFDRCRKLYEKYLEWRPENCRAWCRFAELEKSLGEAARCRAIFELAITQPVLDMPEILWKARPPTSFTSLLPPSLPLCRQTPALSAQSSGCAFCLNGMRLCCGGQLTMWHVCYVYESACPRKTGIRSASDVCCSCCSRT